jgi:acyl-CoA oxidase
MAREIMGGNGILIENRAIKALMDIEGVYTYEGTYEVNALVAGREITGLSAFK